MFLKVQNADGSEAGYINLDNVDLVQVVDSGTTAPNTVNITIGEKEESYKLSKSASQDLMRYLNRYGLM